LAHALVFIILLFYHIYLLLYHSYGAISFQGVHSTVDGCPGKTWGPDEKRINKLAFIGRNLDETALRKGIKGCLV
jgi:G3E family GTPase